MSGREASIFACFADTVLAPRPPLPPIAETDAVRAFGDWLERAPRLNRTGARALLLALEAAPRLSRGHARWRTLPREQRLAFLELVERRGGRSAVEALRAAAAVSYYGDPCVASAVGYDGPRAMTRAGGAAADGGAAAGPEAA